MLSHAFAKKTVGPNRRFSEPSTLAGSAAGPYQPSADGFWMVIYSLAIGNGASSPDHALIAIG
jgi:hypothetical protein